MEDKQQITMADETPDASVEISEDIAIDTESRNVDEINLGNPETTDSNLDQGPSDDHVDVEVSELDMLIKERSGMFKVSLDAKDASYLKGLMDKAEYTGPHEAYLVVISKLELSSITVQLNGVKSNDRKNFDISSATIETLNYFMNKKTGKGTDSAQRLFSASMVIRQALNIISELDAKINELKKIQNSTDK